MKLTGLPFNTTQRDLLTFLESIKAKTYLYHVISNIVTILTRILTLTIKMTMILLSNLNTNSKQIFYSGLILLPLIVEDVETLNMKLKTVNLKNLQIHTDNYTIVLTLPLTDLLRKPICIQITIPQIHK